MFLRGIAIMDSIQQIDSLEQDFRLLQFLISKSVMRDRSVVQRPGPICSKGVAFLQLFGPVEEVDFGLLKGG